MMKNCGGCDTTKPVDEFYRRKSAKDGRQSRCKDCVRKYWQGWYAKNGDSVRARSLAIARADPEVNRQKANAWNAANPERHYERSREAKHRRRVLEKGTAVGPIDYDTLWDSQAGTCPLCDTPIDTTIKHPDLLSRSLDHIVPISRGGGHVQENVQWTHLGCNLRKAASVQEVTV